MPAPRDPSGAVGRAYARRAGRHRRLGGAGPQAAEGRSQFVLTVMAMLGIGLVVSLWLSTTAAADSYRLASAHRSTRDMSERIEVVRSQIAALQSAPELARAARSLGMVQPTDVARLMVAPDGHVDVFGTPKVAAVPASPPPPGAPAPSTTAVTPGPAPIGASAAAGAGVGASAGVSADAGAGAGVPEQPTDRMTPEQLVAQQAAQEPAPGPSAPQAVGGIAR